MDSTPKEIKLMQHLSCRNGQLSYSKEQHTKCIALASKNLVKYGGYHAIKSFRIESEDYVIANVYTHIDDYTNKKGHTSKAHFNANDKYVGSVSKHGEDPILVPTWTKVTEENFDKYWYVNMETGLLIPRDKPASDSMIKHDSRVYRDASPKRSLLQKVDFLERKGQKMSRDLLRLIQANKKLKAELC